jgi:Lon protease-like protein
VSTLPLFPLRTVLFPGGWLRLRIFEPRYLDMVRRCLRGAEPFGVVLIHGGGETGPIDEVATIGTSARLVDFETLPDGLLGLSCRGERRFRLLRRTLQADGLHIGEVEWLTEPPATPLPASQQPLAQLLRRALAAAGNSAQVPEPRYDEADWVSWRIAELLPLDAAMRQALLQTDAAQERLRRLAPLLAAAGAAAD